MDGINVQHELTIHNINGLHQHHHLYGLMVCAVICFVIPLTDRYLPALRGCYRRIDMPIFPRWTWPLPALGFAFMIGPRLFGQNLFVFDEMGELYLAMAFFGFGISTYAGARMAIDPEFAPAPAPRPGLAAAALSAQPGH